jgi:hypothetical protein
MADKSKQRARALRAKTGMSYQAAKQALSKLPASPRINILHSFRWDTDRRLTFSERCPSCQRWIHCREPLQQAKCFCGEPYRVVFDREPDSSMKQGPCCMECGTQFGVMPPEERRNPWRPTNLFQIRCGVCVERAYHVEHIRWLEDRGRRDSIRSLARYESTLTGPDAEALIARAHAAHEEVARFHAARMKKLEKLEEDVTADTPIDDPEYRAASHRLCDLMNELEAAHVAQRQRSTASMEGGV